MPRGLWKGAISFGLVNVPVELVAAEKRSTELDLTMIDRRDLAPVGYKRYNKASGEDVPWSEIVKGYEYEDGKYVVLSDEDFRRANVEASKTVDIQAFVDLKDIPRLGVDILVFGGAKAGAVRERPVAYGAGWICGAPEDYDREHCVDLAQLSVFLRDTQPEVVDALAEGAVIAMVPLVEGWGRTYESDADMSPEERAIHFGQPDHVRYYGADFRDRLRQAGFELAEFTAGGSDSVRYRLNRGEKVFLGIKTD